MLFYNECFKLKLFLIFFQGISYTYCLVWNCLHIYCMFGFLTLMLNSFFQLFSFWINCSLFWLTNSYTGKKVLIRLDNRRKTTVLTLCLEHLNKLRKNALSPLNKMRWRRGIWKVNIGWEPQEDPKEPLLQRQPVLPSAEEAHLAFSTLFFFKIYIVQLWEK